MKRTASILLTALLVVGAVGAVPMTVAAQPAADGASAQSNSVPDIAYQETEQNVSDNESVRPGERLSAVVSTQRAEIEGDVERRAYGLRIAANASAQARSQVVADQFEEIRQRLEHLEQRRAQLQQARENGSMSGGESAAEAADMAAKADNAREMLNRTEQETEGLPADLLASHDVNASAIQTLKDEASSLSGSDVARIARQIAGSEMGEQMRAGMPGDRGPTADSTQMPGDRVENDSAVPGPQDGDRTVTTADNAGTADGTQPVTTRQAGAGSGGDAPSGGSGPSAPVTGSETGSNDR